MKRPSNRSRIVSLAVIGVLATVALVFHARLVAWFTGQQPGSAGAAVTVTAGSWKVSAALDPDPPHTQGQRVHATVTDPAGTPVSDARVDITYDMPAMGQMGEMKSTFRAVAANGGYDAGFDLPMPGTWGLWVQVASKGACAIARYTLTVGQPGLTADGAAPCGTSATTIQIDEARQREIGITTGKVSRGPMTLSIRATGRVTYDETRLHDVVLKVGGYVSDLRVRAIGQPVKRGEPLFLLYSPELFSAEQDYLVALASKGLIGSGGGGNLVRAAEQKLELLGLDHAQIAEIAAKNQAIEKIRFTAPASGSVIEKNVVEGDAVQAGQRLFRIAALDKVWVEADLFEPDLANVHVGMAAKIALGSSPAPALEGKVTFVYPYLDPQTRTGRVRIELPNQGLDLKPDMYAAVTFDVVLPDRLQVPSSAIVYAGPRRLVFVELGGGRIRPQEVTLGAHADTTVEIASGLVEGDVVVTSGNFLVASEARLRAPEGSP